jgi:hypothetical protein
MYSRLCSPRLHPRPPRRCRRDPGRCSLGRVHHCSLGRLAPSLAGRAHYCRAPGQGMSFPNHGAAFGIMAWRDHARRELTYTVLCRLCLDLCPRQAGVSPLRMPCIPLALSVGGSGESRRHMCIQECRTRRAATWHGWQGLSRSYEIDGTMHCPCRVLPRVVPWFRISVRRLLCAH